jgi:HSP20 family protein
MVDPYAIKQEQPTMTLARITPRNTPGSPFNALVNEFFGRDIARMIGHDEPQRSAPAVNIVERDDRFELHVPTPGFDKEDLKLQLENDILTIRAEHKKEENDQGARYTRREFMLRSFERSFRLPEQVNGEGLQAHYTNGVLNVHIPKAAAAMPKVREIGIN